MFNMHSVEVNSSNLTERFDLLSNMISETFQAKWTAEPIGREHRPASLCWAESDGVRFCHAEMSPLHLINRASRPENSGLYYIYTADQPSRVQLTNGEVVDLHARDFLIHDADRPIEWYVQSDYVTRSLLIDKELFHEYVPRESPMIGRRLLFPFGVERILTDMLGSAYAVTRAGMFEHSGPKLVRAFLSVLAMIPQQSDCAITQGAGSALDIRRLQVKNFIDRNYHLPNLCITSIARHLYLSPRYIQMAFASDDVTPLDYLRNRRLSACASLLGDPARRSTTITDIALSCGFNSSAYFSTEFRRVYGMSPRAYRAAHCAGHHPDPAVGSFRQ